MNEQDPGIDVVTDEGETKRIYFSEPEEHNRIGQMQLSHGLTYNFEAPDDESIAEMAQKIGQLAQREDEGAFITFTEPMYGRECVLFRNGARQVRGLCTGFMDKVSPEVKMREMQAQQRAAMARSGQLPALVPRHRN